MADKKKLDLVIKSDGTPEGTSLMVNGADVTKTLSIIGISFSAYDDGSVYASWTALTADDKGVEKRESYNFSNLGKNSDRAIPVMKKTKKVVIGKDAETQFSTEQERAAYELTKKLKTLDEVIDIEKEENPK